METLPVQSLTWQLVVQIKPFGITNELTNIIHVTEKGGDLTDYGDRIPAINFYPNSTKLEITSSVNGEINHRFQLCAISLPLFVYTEVSIEQSYDFDRFEYSIIVKINGTTCQEVVNDYVIEFNNVTIYASSLWYSASKAKIKGFQFKNI